jgi:hypothetical protein
VEDEGKRDQCSRILQQQHHATVTEMREHNNGNGGELLEGIAANYTSTSRMLQQVVSMAFPSNCMEDLAEYIYTNGKCNRNRDVGDDSKRINKDTQRDLVDRKCLHSIPTIFNICLLIYKFLLQKF